MSDNLPDPDIAQDVNALPNPSKPIQKEDLSTPELSFMDVDPEV